MSSQSKLPSPIITEASLSHLPALRRLFVDAVRTHFTYFTPRIQRRVIREHNLLRLGRAALHPHRVVLVAHAGNQLVGYAIGSVPAPGSGQLYWLYVDPAQRGQNLGLSLLSRMLRLQQQRGAIEVTLATHDHRRYYERQGFAWVENRLVDGVNMDIMRFRVGKQVEDDGGLSTAPAV
ncbi:MAG TPA: GNAT family N-acetyltransferase [Candidatus Saccharimonas sp.]|nr:GNAT family N-acetyltransferase [Candidatus Saccharimonas sp.]